MKKTTLVLVAAALASAAGAQNTITMSATTANGDNSEAATFANSYVEDNSLRFNDQRTTSTNSVQHYTSYVAQMLYKAQDLAALPKNAVLTGMSLKGAFVDGQYLNSDISAAIYLQSAASVEALNTTATASQLTLPGSEHMVTNGKQSYQIGADQSSLASYVAASRKHSDRAQDDLVMQQFSFAKPYTYDGNGLLVTQDVERPAGSATHLLQYLDVANVSTGTPVVYHFSDAAASASGYYLNGTMASDQNAQFQYGSGDFNAGQAPNLAFDYYTNDLTGSITDNDGNPVREKLSELTDLGKRLQPNGAPLIALYDVNDKTWIAPDGYTLNSYRSAELTSEDGSFKYSALDHSHTYWLMAASSNAGTSWLKIDFAQGQDGEKQDWSRLDTSNLQPNDVSESQAVGNDIEAVIKMNPVSPTIPGDTNGDGLVDASDVTTLITVVLGSGEATDAADVNGDGVVDASDVTALISIVLGN